MDFSKVYRELYSFIRFLNLKVSISKTLYLDLKEKARKRYCLIILNRSIYFRSDNWDKKETCIQWEEQEEKHYLIILNWSIYFRSYNWDRKKLVPNGKSIELLLQLLTSALGRLNCKTWFIKGGCFWNENWKGINAVQVVWRLMKCISRMFHKLLNILKNGIRSYSALKTDWLTRVTRPL